MNRPFNDFHDMTLPCDSNNATASPSPKRTYSIMHGNIPRLFFCSSSGGHLITNLEYGPYCLPNISPLSIAPQNKHNPPRHPHVKSPPALAFRWPSFPLRLYNAPRYLPALQIPPLHSKARIKPSISPPLPLQTSHRHYVEHSYTNT